MGYSQAVVCKSKKLQQKMLDFMEKNFRVPSEYGGMLLKCDYPHADLGYCHYKNQVGISYTLLKDGEMLFIWSLMRWMALKVGKKTKLKGLPEAVLYHNYDGEANYPVLLEAEWKDRVSPEQKQYLCDSLGLRKVPETDKRFWRLFPSSASVADTVKQAEDIAEREIKRLEELWNKNIDK